MRMWLIDVRFLCRKHLLGEHLEMHYAAGTVAAGKKVNPRMVEVHRIKERHQELAEEMERRGYKHKSPLREFVEYNHGNIDIEHNKRDLFGRCSECSLRHQGKEEGK